MNDAQRFLRLLPSDKIKINWNKNPIRMETFLSFLTVPVKRSFDHLGHDNGWTRLRGDNDLVIRGGIVKGVEYLDGLEYGSHLDNAWNNYINPFYIFDILNQEGKDFFFDYYADDINKEFLKANKQLERAQLYKDELDGFWTTFGFTHTLKEK